MEDLVPVGIADPVEDPRVGQRPLQRVALPTDRGGEVRGGRGVHVEAAAIALTPEDRAELDRAFPLPERELPLETL